MPFPAVVDSSMLSVARSCRHKLHEMYFNHWKPLGESIHLHAGKAYASGLEAARKAFFVDGKSEEDSMALGAQALLTSYGTNYEAPPDSAKSLERVAGALDYYFEQWPLSTEKAIPYTFPGGKKGIEVGFVEPLPVSHPDTGDPILFCGRADQVVEFADGLFGEDDKTATQLGGSWAKQWDLRGQFTGYCWGFEKAAGIPFRGFLIRGVSILKTQYGHAEAITYRAPWQIEEWLENTVHLVEALVKDYVLGRWEKNLDNACNEWGGCAFRNSCLSNNPAPWLEQYFERRVWDPVRRTEHKVEA